MYARKANPLQPLPFMSHASLFAVCGAVEFMPHQVGLNTIGCIGRQQAILKAVPRGIDAVLVRRQQVIQTQITIELERGLIRLVPVLNEVKKQPLTIAFTINLLISLSILSDSSSTLWLTLANRTSKCPIRSPNSEIETGTALYF